VDQLCAWFARELGPDVPLHFTAFHPDYRMRDVPPTPASTLARARQQALGYGLRYVYTGNVHDPRGQSTYCGACSALVIERDRYTLGSYALAGNRCAACGSEVPGHFRAQGPGDWGTKRLRVVAES
jgi:pyruvate formate lyase activating enzyme